jgi:hypothetical protein
MKEKPESDLGAGTKKRKFNEISNPVVVLK